MTARLPVGWDPATAPRVLVCLPGPLLPLVLGRLVPLLEARFWAPSEYNAGYNAISEVIDAMSRPVCLSNVEKLLSMVVVRLDTLFGGASYGFSTTVEGGIIYEPPIPAVPLVDSTTTPYNVGIDIRTEAQQQTPIQEDVRQLLEDIKASLAQDDIELEDILQKLEMLAVLLG